MIAFYYRSDEENKRLENTITNENEHRTNLTKSIDNKLENILFLDSNRPLMLKEYKNWLDFGRAEIEELFKKIKKVLLNKLK